MTATDGVGKAQLRWFGPGLAVVGLLTASFSCARGGLSSTTTPAVSPGGTAVPTATTTSASPTGDDENVTGPPTVTMTVGAPATDGPPQISGARVVTASGLEYFDINVGTGASPQPGETVQVYFESWLEDGTEVYSNFWEIKVGAGVVIAGLDEGVATMRVGGKRRLIIPPELAYGASGTPPTIPPNATLIFDVKLVQIR